MKKTIVRRDFIKTATAAAAVLPAVSASAVSTSVPQFKLNKRLPSKVFGKIGLRLPVFCFGGAQLASKWGNNRGMEGTAKYIQYAYDKGLRYFDTAGNYGTSQAWLGHGIKANKLRDKVFLATKIETTNPQHTRRDVERCLKELQTDYIDLLQMHGTPGIENMSVKTAFKIHAQLVKMKDEGIIKNVGLSAHSYFDKALELISSGGFDQCMLALGYFPRGYDQYFSPRMIDLREKCVAKAHSLKMGIVAMKVMGRGTLGLEPYAIAPEMSQTEKARYFHLDWLIPWYISDYISLDSEQKNMLEKRLLAQLDWHCRTQLPVYAETLRALGIDVADPENPIDVQRLKFHYSRIMELWKVLLLEVAPDIIDLMLTASDDQINELFSNLAERNQEFREKYVDLPTEELNKNRQKRMQKNLDFWISDLTPEQKQTVADWSSGLMPIAEEWLQNRERVQAYAQTLMETRNDSPEFREKMFELIVYPKHMRPAAYQKKFDFNTDVTLKFIIQLARLLTPKQRQHFLKRIASLASDFDKISCDPYAVSKGD